MSAYDFIRVNYGINRRSREPGGFSHENGSMRIKGVWGEDATNEKIKAIIRRRNPGWNITGWALMKEKK